MVHRRIATTNRTAVYLIAFTIIVVAFLILGGGPIIMNLMHGNGSPNLNNWNWTQILISLGIGFALGWLVSRR